MLVFRFLWCFISRLTWVCGMRSAEQIFVTSLYAHIVVQDSTDQFSADTLNARAPVSRLTNLYDNDIIWDEGDSVFRDPLVNSGRLGPDDYWPNNGQGIPYSITHFDAQGKQKIKDSLRIIEQRTGFCITFKQRSEEREYIKFQPGRRCSSYIGRRTGRETTVILAAECLTAGVIQHEILHALGFFHEQNRPDRDEHISINFENIRADIHPVNYQKLPEMATYGLPYDLNSIMHYGPFDMFNSHQRQRVIIPKRDQLKMGQRQGLSVLDVTEVQMAYNCSLDHLTAERSSKENHVYRPTVVRNGLGTFPNFSSDPMTPEQCALQFSTNCHPSGFKIQNCAETRLLQISCDRTAVPMELQKMAADLSEGPLRAVRIQIHDGDQLSFDNFAVIRKQVIRLIVETCFTSRTTAELPQLQFSSLLSFVLKSCYGMHIKRSDFSHAIQLKEIILWNSTVQNLEQETFTDLPALRLLTLEYGLHTKATFGKHVRDYLISLHCGCKLAWFRRWWTANRQLLRRAAAGEVYNIPFYWETDSWDSYEIYLRIDCSESPFPSGAASIDFAQTDFSINDDIDLGTGITKCWNTYSETMEPLPVFSEIPITSEECALQFGIHCVPSKPSRCPAFMSLEIDCNSQATSAEVKLMATLMAVKPPRATRIDLFDGVTVAYANFASINARIVLFTLWQCRNSRGTNKPYELRLFNLVKFSLRNCYSLTIVKKDFQRMSRLRIIELRNSTVLTLEVGTFMDLPSLRVVALENGFKKMDLFSVEISVYIFRLHCSCEFAWYRQWWKRNTALLRQAEFGAVFSFEDAWANFAYEKGEIYLPIDCSTLPDGSSSINFDQIEFSLNENKCTS